MKDEEKYCAGKLVSHYTQKKEKRLSSKARAKLAASETQTIPGTRRRRMDRN
jgi:hypothetical protein